MEAFEGFITKLEADRPAYLEVFGRQFYGRTLVNHMVSEPWMAWTLFQAFQASTKATIDCVRAFGETDMRADCRAIKAPTLVIHGTAYRTVPIDPTGRAAAKLIPNARLIEYDGEPHGLFATASYRLNGDLLQFLSGRS